MQDLILEIMQWEWTWPQVLWLIPLPALILLLPKSQNNSGALITPFWHRLLAAQSSSVIRSNINWLRLIWLWILWIIILMALARPVLIGKPIALPREGRNLLIAVDISASMRQQDMLINNRRVDRLSAVKEVLKTFLERRQGDKIGLILFGTQAFVQAPLTFDIKTLQQFLDETIIGLAGDKTAIGDAIGLAIKQSENDTEDRVLILLTDGENSAGNVSPEEAAKYAGEKKLKIHTVAFGKDRFGRNFKPQSLINIANVTGGKSFQASRTKDLKKIYDTIDELEPIEGEQAFFRLRSEQYFKVLMLALFWVAVTLTALGIRKIWSKKDA